MIYNNKTQQTIKNVLSEFLEEDIKLTFNTDDNNRVRVENFKSLGVTKDVLLDFVCDSNHFRVEIEQERTKDMGHYIYDKSLPEDSIINSKEDYILQINSEFVFIVNPRRVKKYVNKTLNELETIYRLNNKIYKQIITTPETNQFIKRVYLHNKGELHLLIGEVEAKRKWERHCEDIVKEDIMKDMMK